MDRQDHLLIRAMEECAEVQQRLSKALVFGLERVQQAANDRPEQNPDRLTNRERIIEEYNDLVAVMEMAGFPLSCISGAKLDTKMAKVERYLKLSVEHGRLEEARAEPDQRYPFSNGF